MIFFLLVGYMIYIIFRTYFFIQKNMRSARPEKEKQYQKQGKQQKEIDISKSARIIEEKWLDDDENTQPQQGKKNENK